MRQSPGLSQKVFPPSFFVPLSFFVVGGLSLGSVSRAAAQTCLGRPLTLEGSADGDFSWAPRTMM